ncbi:unnamed protein product [Aphanomyces euteiches]
MRTARQKERRLPRLFGSKCQDQPNTSSFPISLNMAQSGSFKTKIGDARDPIGNEMKAITIDDAEATNLEEEEEEGVVEDAENSLFDLFIERKRSVIMKRLENISDDDLAALNSDEGVSYLAISLV